jgi:transposase-like protein
MASAREPRNLLEAVRYFSDEEVAFNFVVKLRWPTGKPVCPRCGCMEVSFLSTRSIWKCKACKRQFSLRVGTIFEDSPLPFSKWLPAMWLISNSKNGISSCELGRAIGITQKSAWYMLHRIRLAMATGTFEKLSGTVEIDETFVGGLSRNMHKSARAKLTGTGGSDKTIVVGILERGVDGQPSQVTASVQPDRTRATLLPLVHQSVAVGSTVYSDTHTGYIGLSGLYFSHQVVDHAVTYVLGNVHTNSIESFWNLLKRGLKGTYTHCNPEHLNRYVAERIFTFNQRDKGDLGRMRLAVKGASGRKLTYAELTA